MYTKCGRAIVILSHLVHLLRWRTTYTNECYIIIMVTERNTRRVRQRRYERESERNNDPKPRDTPAPGSCARVRQLSFSTGPEDRSAVSFYTDRRVGSSATGGRTPCRRARRDWPSLDLRPVARDAPMETSSQDSSSGFLFLHLTRPVGHVV